MARRKKTRVPLGPGGVPNLKETYERHRENSEEGCRRMIEELQRRGFEITKENWDEVLTDTDPPTCSWRTALRPACRPMLDKARGLEPPEEGPPTRGELSVANEALAKALKCVAERDVLIAEQKVRITELEERNAKLSKGTRERRPKRRRGAQALQTGSAEPTSGE